LKEELFSRQIIQEGEFWEEIEKVEEFIEEKVREVVEKQEE